MVMQVMLAGRIAEIERVADKDYYVMRLFQPGERQLVTVYVPNFLPDGFAQFDQVAVDGRLSVRKGKNGDVYVSVRAEDVRQL